MDIMDLDHALVAFSALSQETRLKVFKILVEYGSTGTAAGTISDRLGIPHNTLSFHLAQLSHVKLVTSEIPLSELFGYTTAIRGMSQGRASATMEFLEYRQMPSNLMKEVLAAQS